MNRESDGPSGAILFGLVSLVSGAAVVYFFGLPILYETRASRSWPATMGTITTSFVESRRVASSSKGPLRSHHQEYSPHVEYSFVVNGVQHTGDRVSVLDGSSGRSSAEQTVAKYPVGRQIKVYYNPQTPNLCLLQIGGSETANLPLVTGCLLSLFGTALVGGAILKLRRATTRR